MKAAGRRGCREHEAPPGVRHPQQLRAPLPLSPAPCLLSTVGSVLLGGHWLREATELGDLLVVVKGSPR